MKPAADVVAHAAERHGAQRLQHHPACAGGACPRVLAQEKQQLRRPWKLGGLAEPAEPGVERGAKLLDRRLEGGRGRHGRPRRSPIDRPEPFRERVGRLDDLTALRLPDAGDLPQDVDESGTSPFRRWRKIRAAVKRFQLRCEPHAHRPSARSGGRLHEHHVDAIDVGTLFAIDFDRHEMLVEHRRDCVGLERFVLHHVTPVAGGVSDGEKDRLVFGPRPGERLVVPGEPVDGILRVLQQIRAALTREAIHQSHYDTGAQAFTMTGPRCLHDDRAARAFRAAWSRIAT